jgi:hypothetical protein
MFAFRKTLQFSKKGAGIDKDQVSHKMTGIPTVITDGLLTRFTESARGSTRYAIPSSRDPKHS